MLVLEAADYAPRCMNAEMIDQLENRVFMLHPALEINKYEIANEYQIEEHKFFKLV